MAGNVPPPRFTGNRQVDATQRELGEGIRRQSERFEGSIANGALLESLALTTTATEFTHGLGRAWKGALIVKDDTGGALVTADGPTPAKSLLLSVAAGTATVSVWVF